MTTASQGTVSAASSANIAHGVRPPLTAKWKLPLAATASRARSATNAAPARATASGSGRDSNSWCMLCSHSFSSQHGWRRGRHVIVSLSFLSLSLPELMVERGFSGVVGWGTRQDGRGRRDPPRSHLIFVHVNFAERPFTVHEYQAG